MPAPRTPKPASNTAPVAAPGNPIPVPVQAPGQPAVQAGTNPAAPVDATAPKKKGKTPDARRDVPGGPTLLSAGAAGTGVVASAVPVLAQVSTPAQLAVGLGAVGVAGGAMATRRIVRRLRGDKGKSKAGKGTPTTTTGTSSGGFTLPNLLPNLTSGRGGSSGGSGRGGRVGGAPSPRSGGGLPRIPRIGGSGGGGSSAAPSPRGRAATAGAGGGGRTRTTGSNPAGSGGRHRAGTTGSTTGTTHAAGSVPVTPMARTRAGRIAQRAARVAGAPLRAVGAARQGVRQGDTPGQAAAAARQHAQTAPHRPLVQGATSAGLAAGAAAARSLRQRWSRRHAGTGRQLSQERHLWDELVGHAPGETAPKAKSGQRRPVADKVRTPEASKPQAKTEKPAGKPEEKVTGKPEAKAAKPASTPEHPPARPAAPDATQEKLAADSDADAREPSELRQRRQLLARGLTDPEADWYLARQLQLQQAGASRTQARLQTERELSAKRERQRENTVLAMAGKLDPDDRSPEAEQLRQVAAGIEERRAAQQQRVPSHAEMTAENRAKEGLGEPVNRVEAAHRYGHWCGFQGCPTCTSRGYGPESEVLGKPQPRSATAERPPARPGAAVITEEEAARLSQQTDPPKVPTPARTPAPAAAALRAEQDRQDRELDKETDRKAAVGYAQVVAASQAEREYHLLQQANAAQAAANKSARTTGGSGAWVEPPRQPVAATHSTPPPSTTSQPAAQPATQSAQPATTSAPQGGEMSSHSPLVAASAEMRSAAVRRAAGRIGMLEVTEDSKHWGPALANVVAAIKAEAAAYDRLPVKQSIRDVLATAIRTAEAAATTLGNLNPAIEKIHSAELYKLRNPASVGPNAHEWDHTRNGYKAA